MRRCLRRHPNYRTGPSRKTVKTQLGEVEIKELCDVEISPELVTKITEKIMPEVTPWQNRSLEAVYPFIFMDGIRFGPSVKSCVSEIRQSQVWSSENRVE